jgi:hypothetical protein
MGLLDSLLSYVDSRKRVAGSNLADIRDNPRAAMQGLLSSTPETVAERERKHRETSRRLQSGGGLLGGSVMPGVDKISTSPEFDAAMNAPMGLLMGMGIKAKTLERGLLGDPGYVYHATNADNLAEIVASKKLKTHKPNYGTDQDSWPDMSTEARSYFGSSPENLWQFAPEYGRGVVIRTKLDARIRKESGTGDLFARQPIPSKDLEFLGEDMKWHPLKDLEP